LKELGAWRILPLTAVDASVANSQHGGMDELLNLLMMTVNPTGMARVNEGSHSLTCHPHVYPRTE